MLCVSSERVCVRRNAACLFYAPSRMRASSSSSFASSSSKPGGTLVRLVRILGIMPIFFRGGRNEYGVRTTVCYYFAIFCVFWFFDVLQRPYCVIALVI